MDIRSFCITILVPTYVSCFYLLLMPFGFGLLVNSVLGKIWENRLIYGSLFNCPFYYLYLLVKDDLALEIKNMQLAYPVCLGGLLIFYITSLGVYISDRWVQDIREDHFLVGRTLHNMDE